MTTPTGNTRVPRTDNLPPPTDDPGPVSPVDLRNLTDPTAYYNQQVAAGIPPRQAAYRPRDAGRDEGDGIDPSTEPTPDAVVAFRMSAHQKTRHEINGDDAHVVVEWYEGQIKKMYENQMDALANQNKELLAHANTRDGFAMGYKQLQVTVNKLQAEILAKQKLEKTRDKMEGTIIKQESEIKNLGGQATAFEKKIEEKEERIEELKASVAEEKQLVVTATAEANIEKSKHEQTKQAFAILYKNWEEQCKLSKGRDDTIAELKTEVIKAHSTAEEARKLAAETKETLPEPSGQNDELEKQRKQWEKQLEAVRATVQAKDASITSLQQTLAKSRGKPASSFASIFARKDDTEELKKQLETEKEKVLARNAAINKLKDAEAAKNAQITELEERLDQYQKRAEGIEGVGNMVDNMLGEHRNTTQGDPGSPRSPSEPTETQLLLKNHYALMARLDSELEPFRNRRRASENIIKAQRALSRGEYSKALSHLKEAEQENNKMSNPDRRVHGRLSYWKGRVEIDVGDARNAIESFEEALRMQRRPSSQGTLYNITKSDPSIANEEEEEPGKPNYWWRWRKLDVEGWLEKAKRAAGEDEV